MLIEMITAAQYYYQLCGGAVVTMCSELLPYEEKE